LHLIVERRRIHIALMPKRHFGFDLKLPDVRGQDENGVMSCAGKRCGSTPSKARSSQRSSAY